MKKITALALWGLLVFTATAQPLTHCGTWRWPVKTITDANGPSLMNMTPEDATIEDLTSAHAPGGLQIGTPRFPDETKVVTITGNIIGYKTELGSTGDHDYHMVIQSAGTDSTLVVEIPSPDCPEFVSHPDEAERFRQLRSWFDQNIGIPTSTFKSTNAIGVQISGVPFWDMPGGHAHGSAINGREIHPALALSLLQPGAASTASSNTPPPININIPPTSSAMQPIPISNSMTDLLELMLLGAILGMTGQVIRLMVGLRKSTQNAPLNPDGTRKSTIDIIDARQLTLSLFIAIAVGAIAGVLAAVNALGISQLDKSAIFAFIGAGYAGTDLIEGFVIQK